MMSSRLRQVPCMINAVQRTSLQSVQCIQRNRLIHPSCSSSLQASVFVSLPHRQSFFSLLPTFSSLAGTTESSSPPSSSFTTVSPSPSRKPVVWSTDDLKNLLPGTTLVRTVADAQRVVGIIKKLDKGLPPQTPATLHQPIPSVRKNVRVHAWDTEVINLDLDNQSPVGHGSIICLSFYSGSDVDYGNGPRVWIDNLALRDDTILNIFKEVLEDNTIYKVWHNYSFDRHMLRNHGIRAMGFRGDTMHMARLYHSALEKFGGYSLASLSANPEIMPNISEAKLPLIDLFGVPKKKKDGTDSKIKELPSLNDIQEHDDREIRKRWIEYSSRDAEVTWRLYFTLREKLADRTQSPWNPAAVCYNPIQFSTVNLMDKRNHNIMRDTEGMNAPTLLELYETVILPFGEALTDMEHDGIMIDVKALESAGTKAQLQRETVIHRFKTWAQSFTGSDDMKYFNIHSDVQKAQLLFGLPKKIEKEDDSGSSESRSNAGNNDAVPNGNFNELSVIPTTVSSSTTTATKGTGSKTKTKVSGAKINESNESVSTVLPLLSTESAVSSNHPTPTKPKSRKKRAAPAIVDDDSLGSTASSSVSSTSMAPHSVAYRTTSSFSSLALVPVAYPKPGPLDSSIVTSLFHWRTFVRSAVPWYPILHRRLSTTPKKSTATKQSDTEISVLPKNTRSVKRTKKKEVGYTSDQDFFAGAEFLTSESEEEETLLEIDSESDNEMVPPVVSITVPLPSPVTVNPPPSSSLSSSSSPSVPKPSSPSISSSTSSSSPEIYVPPPRPSSYRPRPPIEEELEPVYEFETENIDKYIPPDAKPGAKPKKKRPFTVPSLFLPAIERTPKGRASGSAGSIKKLLGKSYETGAAYTKLLQDGCDPVSAKHACERIADLLEISAIDTTVETFIEPLKAVGLEQIDNALDKYIQSLPGSKEEVRQSCLNAVADARKEGENIDKRLQLAKEWKINLEPRVHCSLNLNTETGRLSARRPNLQNQPSLDRDKFRIRSAFITPPGRKLVVADYGQLELRVLAHLSNCKSMIRAFEAGGDFHSRTAMGMYAYVKKAVDNGEVLLEGEETGTADKPSKPLLKDAFKEERRKAKILNFSIAYGKTAFGLAKDWEISREEAQRTVELWYADRPEVQRWQDDTKNIARRKKRVYTILGRHRDLPDIHVRALRAHNERAAINTPIQGSAADIVMCAMLKVWRSTELARLGFRMILQVHDEIIIEGPEQHAEAAMKELVKCMERPFDKPLLVDLVVDAKIVTSWGQAK